MRFGVVTRSKGRSEKLKQPLLQVRNSPFESPFEPNETPGRSKTKKRKHPRASFADAKIQLFTAECKCGKKDVDTTSHF